MANQPLLSIIIPTWNTSAVTARCLATIFKFIPRSQVEVIVVDNGSTDDTAKVFSTRKDIIYLQNSQNLGFSRACNLGARQAKSDLFLFLNSDMELIDSSLLQLAKFYQSTPNIGAVGPAFLHPDKTPQGSVFPPQTVINAIREYWFNQPAFSKYIPNTNSPLKVSSLSGGALMISRHNFDLIGGWDERYFMFFEDLELCRQLHRRHLDIYYYPRCQLIHRHGVSGAKITSPENQWRRLVPSSLIYHGYLEHYLLFFVTYSSQKLKQLISAH